MVASGMGGQGAREGTAAGGPARGGRELWSRTFRGMWGVRRQLERLCKERGTPVRHEMHSTGGVSQRAHVWVLQRQ